MHDRSASGAAIMAADILAGALLWRSFCNAERGDVFQMRLRLDAYEAWCALHGLDRAHPMRRAARQLAEHAFGAAKSLPPSRAMGQSLRTLKLAA